MLECLGNMPVVARIAGVPLSREGDPRGILDLLLAAFLGASFALALSYLLRAFRRARRKPISGSKDSLRADLPPECEQIACGLEEFAREVEGRLDKRLDRLERLLKAADIVLRSDGLRRTENREAQGEASPPDEASAANAASLQNGELRGITEEERERVLELAAVGESPEAISQAVGLLRGEVELILRLFGRETPG